jgi:peptide/nickel transport system ATP-binding protein
VTALLSVDGLTVRHGGARHSVLAVDDVTFDLQAGETLGIVGESGCGKSSLVRAVLGLGPLTAGRVEFEERAVAELDRETLRALRPDMQIVFQDPISSLNPRRTVRDLVEQPLRVWPARLGARERADAVDEMLEAVGMASPALARRRPSQLSGGQAQRVAIARALILRPRMLVCDEPVSSLDVSIQAQVLDVLADLRERMGLAMLFVSHDLAVVHSVSDRVMVMREGQVCEIRPVASLTSSEHPYTRALLASVPRLDA